MTTFVHHPVLGNLVREGQGRRPTAIARFHSACFGAQRYVNGDPVNLTDPSGHDPCGNCNGQVDPGGYEQGGGGGACAYLCNNPGNDDNPNGPPPNTKPSGKPWQSAACAHGCPKPPPPPAQAQVPLCQVYADISDICTQATDLGGGLTTQPQCSGFPCAPPPGGDPVDFRCGYNVVADTCAGILDQLRNRENDVKNDLLNYPGIFKLGRGCFAGEDPGCEQVMVDEAKLQEIMSFRVLVYQKASQMGPPFAGWITTAGTKVLEYGLEVGGGITLHAIGLGEVADAYEILELGYDVWDIHQELTQK